MANSLRVMEKTESYIPKLQLQLSNVLQSTQLDYVSGPCNSFNCLGHFKNVYDDDDDWW